jgi:hypothetical protein
METEEIKLMNFYIEIAGHNHFLLNPLPESPTKERDDTTTSNYKAHSGQSFTYEGEPS